MADPLPELSVWKLTLNGQSAGFLSSVAVPTETSIVIGFGCVIGDFLSGWAFQEMQGQRRIMPGNLITLDTSLRPVYCDAWDSAFIQQAEISAFDASQAGLTSFTLNLQVTNLREVPIPPPGASATGLVSLANSRKSQLRQRLLGRTFRSNLPPAHTSRKDPLPSFVFKVTLSGQLKDLGAQVHPCARIAKACERADFVRGEFRALKTKVSDDTVTAVLDAVGSDIRELASVCSQLVADTGGDVDAAAVRRYYSGKAEVKGFDIADKAVVGDVAGAAEALRWAMMSGEPQVVLADALAEAIHTIARVGPLSGDPYRLASELGMPPWRVQKAQKQARRWSRESVAEAMQLVATLNADVKGAAADADYALESAVRKVAELVADGGR